MSLARPCGRFAPTPSGPLHLGSLYTALASWLEARAGGAEWCLRIDDLDAPRARPEAVAIQLQQLAEHGLRPDRPPYRQSEHQPAYRAALQRLIDEGLCYGCDCSRARLAQSSRAGPDGPVYDGHCRDRAQTGPALALRLRLPAGATVTLEDRRLGRVSRVLDREVGDFVLRRRDGQIGYPLASVIDDRDLGISQIVRGGDLLGSSLRQLWLFDHFGLPRPAFLHLPVLVDAQGRKLSKQNHAPALPAGQPLRHLRRCLQGLGQPSAPAGLDREALLAWALAHWTPARIPALAVLRADDLDDS